MRTFTPVQLSALQRIEHQCQEAALQRPPQLDPQQCVRKVLELSNVEWALLAAALRAVVLEHAERKAQ